MTLETLGWRPEFAAALNGLSNAKFVPARVAREDREQYVVYTGGRALRAHVSGSLRHRAEGRLDFPTVGDWVAIDADGGVIHAVLPRRTLLMRQGAGPAATAQLLAANVDTLLICLGLDGDYNLRRLERYLTFAYAGGVAPMVLLTKADLCPDLDARLSEVEMIAAGAPVIAMSVIDRRGVEAVKSQIPVGATAALVGSSGVGKSSLINALLHREAMAVGAVRSDDSRGRHTTTHRQMLSIPDGGLIIDTPGMRELALLADEDDLSSSFSEIDALAEECRFRDCSHTREPGCAVLRAVRDGELPRERLESYHKQLRELRYLERRENPTAAAEERRRWKVIHKSAQAWMRVKYRGG